MATATLKKSDGVTVVSSTLNPVTTRAMVKSGIAVQVSGNDFTNCKLVNAAADTVVTNASSGTPLLHGTGSDDVRFVPLQYPEKL